MPLHKIVDIMDGQVSMVKYFVEDLQYKGKNAEACFVANEQKVWEELNPQVR